MHGAMLTFVIAACTDAAEALSGGGLEVAPSSEVVTVVEVAFTANDRQRTRVELRDAEGPLLATAWAAGDGGDHKGRFIGAPAASELTARVVTEGGDVLDEVAFSTEAFPPEVPVLTLEGEPGWQGYAAVSVVGAITMPAILDERGRVLWYHLVDTDEPAPRVRVRDDGTGITYLVAPGAPMGDHFLGDVRWAQSEETRWGERLGVTHDFIVHDDGTTAVLTLTKVTYRGESEVGFAITEIAPDGSHTLVWDSATLWPQGVARDDGTQGPHGNTLAWDSARGWYWLTVENADCLLAVDRETATVQFVLGGDRGTIDLAGDDGFLRPHHFSLVGDRLRLHDNRDADQFSRVVEFTLDLEAETATFVDEWQRDPPVYDYALGAVHQRDDGSMLVAWSSSGLIDDLGPDGELLAAIVAPLGTAFGYTEVHETLPGQVRLR
jgi:hypothetical protein